MSGDTRPMSDAEKLANWFSYHPPIAAVRKVREAVYTANASIACGGK